MFAFNMSFTRGVERMRKGKHIFCDVSSTVYLILHYLYYTYYVYDDLCLLSLLL